MQLQLLLVTIRADLFLYGKQNLTHRCIDCEGKSTLGEVPYSQMADFLE